jgi:predicted RNA binding protein YcfA (HicA-like mRNA interferase family)
MAKAREVLAALKRDGWVEIHRTASHRKLSKAKHQHTWSFHDGADLGNSQLRDVAQDFGYTLDQLRKL